MQPPTSPPPRLLGPPPGGGRQLPDSLPPSPGRAAAHDEELELEDDPEECAPVLLGEGQEGGEGVGLERRGLAIRAGGGYCFMKNVELLCPRFYCFGGRLGRCWFNSSDTQPDAARRTLSPPCAPHAARDCTP